MPLQVRRGTNAQRQAMTEPLASGELLYATDTGTLYIGNGTTLGGIAVANLSAQDVKDLSAALFTSGSHSGISFDYDSELGTIDATVDPDLSNYQGVIRASAFSGSLVADDSGLLVDALNSSINLDGTVKGDIIPDQSEAYDIGSSSRKFRDLYLSGSSLFLGDATITATGSAVNLPSGSTVGGVEIGTGSEIVGSGVVEGSNYKINIVADDSTLLLNSSTGEHFGLFKGSFFGEDSTQIIDGHSGVVTGSFVGNLLGSVDGNVIGTLTGNVIGNTTGTHFGNVFGEVEGNTTGFHTGDIKGSVFADDSSLIINGETKLFTNGTLTIDDNNLTLFGTDIIEIGASDGTNPHTLVFPDEQGTYMLDSKSLAGTLFSVSKIGFSSYKDSITSPSAPVAGDFSGAIIGKMYETLSASLVTTGGFLLGTDNNEAIANDTVKGKMYIITNGGTGSSPSIKYCAFDSSGRLAVNQTDAVATLDVNGFAKLAVLTAEPSTLSNGMIAIADGTSWNPAGTGKSVMVVYLGGGWRVAATAP